MMKNIIDRLKNIISNDIIPHIHSPSKKIISNKIDNIAIAKLSEYEIVVHISFSRWYRQSVINIIITLIIIVIGLTTYAFTDKTGLLKLIVAITYLFSYGIFIYRRIININAIISNYRVITYYTNICIHGLLHYSYGTKFKTVAYDIYLDLYNENVNQKIKKIHRITSKLHIVPTNDEVFEIVYKRLAVFVKDIVLNSLVKFIAFIMAFTILGLFVKNLVILEMHFSNIFQTLIYPVYYIFDLIGKIA